MDDLENTILKRAREAFIENGYTDTSMSDIALRVNINRPTLHYYFRTKDKLFQAVFGSIILSMIPRINEIIIQRERPVSNRVADIVDLYYETFTANPCLPIFAIREIYRDVDHLIETIQTLHIEEYMLEAINSIKIEMAEGKIKRIPLHHLFYTFYGLLVIPFVTQNLSRKLLLGGENFTNMLNEWKEQIILQMTALLSNH